MTGYRYFTLEGNGLLRVTFYESGNVDSIESLAGRAGFVENRSAYKYFCGAWGDQKDPWEITPEEAIEQAARYGVTLTATRSAPSLPALDRPEPSVPPPPDPSLGRRLPELFTDLELEDFVSFPQPKRPPRP